MQSRILTFSKAVYNSRIDRNSPDRILLLSPGSVDNPIWGMMRVCGWKVFQFECGIGVVNDIPYGSLLATAVIAQDGQARDMDIEWLRSIRVVCRSFLQASDDS